MKSVSGFELMLLGLIGTFTIVTSGIIPPATVKITEEKNLVFEYYYNKIQLFLLNVLSVTDNNKKVYESIAEHIAINKPANLDFLKEKFDKLIESKCYQLNSSSAILLKTDCEPTYFLNTTIILPYNPSKLTEAIMVGIK